MDLHEQTAKILELISTTSDYFCSDKILFPNNNSDRKECLYALLGLMTCLVAAMGDNPKLAYNLLPEYLNNRKAIMTEGEYQNCSERCMSYYGKFRDIGAEVQFSSPDWEDVMIDRFAKLIITSLNATSSDNSSEIVANKIKELVDAAKSLSESDITVVKVVSHKRAMIAMGIAMVLLLTALGSVFVYAINLKQKSDKLKASVDQLQSQNSDLTSTVASQEEVIASLNNQIDDLSSRNSELGDEISEFSAYIEEHESDIQVCEHIGSYESNGQEGSGRFYSDSYVVTTSGESISINVTMDFYGTCDLQGDNKRISAKWGEFDKNGVVTVTFTPEIKGATTFHFFNDQNDDTFDVLVIYI